MPILKKKLAQGLIGMAAGAAVLAAAVFTAAPNAQAFDTIRWRVPTAFGTNLPGLGDNAPILSDMLNATSGGVVQIRIFEPGALVPALSITDAVKDRKADAGYTWLGYDQGKIPASPLFAARPFGMLPWEYAAWWYEGEGKALGEEIYGKEGVHPVLCGLIGPETAGWFRSEINSVRDFEGLKIRFAGLGGKVLQKLGASVTLLPAGELFQALETGAIDATEFSMPAIDQALGFDKIVKINYFPGWHQTYTAFHLIVNKAVWDGLTDQTRALIDTACTATTFRNLAKGEAIQGAVIAGFPDKGVSAQRIPDEMLRELQRVTAEVMEEEAAANADFKRVYESQERFAEVYRNWKTLGYLPTDF
jgi:TRAP-type mannitol/chloroaromatic compound transport system substrate-binding protein